MKIILGITGASGVIYGIRLLETLKKTEHEVALIISAWGKKTIALETDYKLSTVINLADTVYENDDLAAAVSSGSFKADAMVIAPCSMKTLSAVAQGYSENLIPRVADVALKERRPLVMMVRETPLSTIHLENMLKATQAGAILVPPLVAFYHRPQTVEEIINQSVGKVLDLLHIEHDLFPRWGA
ncbi:MAG TPA: UbiX family flavin prenyltransferase [Clostridiales bacterium]|nr:UbiX family flavin prenyltransferase [Clostridiales bacterium]